MINKTVGKSPLSVLHEDTELILDLLANKNIDSKKEKVKLPLTIKEENFDNLSLYKTKSIFFGIMVLDFNDSFYFVQNIVDLAGKINGVKLSIPIFGGFDFFLNKEKESIYCLLAQNLQFFNNLDGQYLTYLISGLYSAGIGDSFVEVYLKRVGRSYVLENLQDELVFSNVVVNENFSLKSLSRSYFLQEELFDSFQEKIKSCSELSGVQFSPMEPSMPSRSRFQLLFLMFEAMNTEYKVKTLISLIEKVNDFKAQHSFALFVSFLWDKTTFTSSIKQKNENKLIILATEIAAAIIANNIGDEKSSLFYDLTKSEKLFSYIFLEPDKDNFKELFLKQLEKRFELKERAINLQNPFLISLLLRKDFGLNLDKKLVELLNLNDKNELYNFYSNNGSYLKDEIWNDPNVEEVLGYYLFSPIVKGFKFCK
jgi:hypothetical protein